MEKAARAAVGGDVKALAWGDRAAGCYLIEVSVRGGNGEDADDARAALAKIEGEMSVAGLKGKARGWATPDGEAVVSSAAACVYNDREPAACEAACAGVWAKLTSPPVIP